MYDTIIWLVKVSMPFKIKLSICAFKPLKLEYNITVPLTFHVWNISGSNILLYWPFHSAHAYLFLPSKYSLLSQSLLSHKAFISWKQDQNSKFLHPRYLKYKHRIIHSLSIAYMFYIGNREDHERKLETIK